MWNMFVSITEVEGGVAHRVALPLFPIELLGAVYRPSYQEVSKTRGKTLRMWHAPEPEYLVNGDHVFKKTGGGGARIWCIFLVT